MMNEKINVTIICNNECYNEDDFSNFLIDLNKEDVNVKILNESKNKEFKKATFIKRDYGAVLLPFIKVEGENNYIRAFYREDSDENTYNYIFGCIQSLKDGNSTNVDEISLYTDDGKFYGTFDVTNNKFK